MPTPLAPVCLDCKHFHDNDDSVFSCDAFPDGIVDIVIFGENDHRSPIAGDRGIQFEPRAG